MNVVTSQKEFDKLSKYTQHISFAKESCNENTFTNLDFSRFSNLQSIEVGDNSLMYVKNVKIDGLSKLEKVNIGQNSFTEYRNGHASNSQDNSFVMKNCDSLKSLSIDRYSFSNYNSFIIESKIVVRVWWLDTPSLKEMKIGDENEDSYNFYHNSLQLSSINSELIDSE